MSVRIDFDEDATFGSTAKMGGHEVYDGADDIAISGDMIEGVHIERMHAGHVWGCITLKDGRRLILSFTAKRRIYFGARCDG